MTFKYGQSLQLKKNVNLNFYVDGILPAGQLGYTETHYKIRFDEADMVMAGSLVEKLLEEKTYEENVVPDPAIRKSLEEKTVEDEVSSEPETAKSLKEKPKDDLIALASAIDSTEDLTKLKKDDLIKIIMGEK